MADTDENEPKCIDLTGCAKLLGWPTQLLWCHWKLGKFASSAGSKNGRPFWHENDVYRWALSAHPMLSSRIPLRYWPDAKRPAAYHGARKIKDAMVQIWATDLGMVCVLWSDPRVSGLPSLERVVAQLPHADALVRVESEFRFFGPGLSIAQPGNPTRWNRFGARWSDLARILGQPAPYWPLMLRIPTLIDAWKPGAPTSTYLTIPEINTTPLLRMAAILRQGSFAQLVLFDLARLAQLRSTTGALSELQYLADCEERAVKFGHFSGDVTVVAARPLSVPEIDGEILNESARRAGWLELTERTDELAEECVHLAKMWDGNRHFRFSNLERIDPTTEYGAEWSARLTPIERTAEFAIINRDRDGETLTDPETDAPVVREPDGFLWATIPQRLPARSPLAEVILDCPIWVRTEDGTLYLAPRDSYWGLNWGYPGSGPGSLALLISRLLDDINAPGADNATGAPAGLERLTEAEWPNGTVLTRAQLEAARDDLHYSEEP